MTAKTSGYEAKKQQARKNKDERRKEKKSDGSWASS